MMQKSFSELEYSAKKKRTRRDIFLGELERITPWDALEQRIAPFYPSSGSPGRPPIGLARILRMYVAQQCFGLSDEGMEDVIYDSQAIRNFVGIDLSRESAPDTATLLKFRHLLERHQLTESLFGAINAHLAEKGLLLREGTIVDATLIVAPSSTKNQKGERDPEMHQSKKGNQWQFWFGSHRGGHGGNISDVSQAQALLQGEESMAFGDAGYQGVEKHEEHLETPVIWHTAMRPGKRRALDKSPEGEAQEMLEQTKTSIRAKVEHPFHVVKNLFRHRKARYRGLAKNTAQLFTLFAFANLMLARRWLLVPDSQVAS